MLSSPVTQRILFLCTGNSARSQMAEGWLRALAGDQFEVHSAGTLPSRVHPLAIDVMRECGIDLSSHRSKSVEEYAGQPFGTVITVCDHARESCPAFPGCTRCLHWSLEDPAAVQGPRDSQYEVFRRVRDEIRHRLQTFLEGGGNQACASGEDSGGKTV